MTLPWPNLDDRGFQEIVDEAIRLIPRYCPEWTNHNPSDPGITLIEIFAYLVETILYRLNRMPEKATAAYLRLLGHHLLPGHPSRAPVTFQLVEGAGPCRLPEGTPLSTRQGEGQKGVPFETEREILIVPARIVRCLSRVAGRFADLTPALAHTSSSAGPSVPGEGEGVPIFSGISRIDRLLYLGDPRWAALRWRVTVTLDDGGAGVAGILEWEYWNGRGWREMPIRSGPSGEVVFEGPVPGIAERSVNGEEGWWVRGRLDRDPPGRITRLRMRLEGSGIAPEHASSDRDGSLEVPIDLSRSLHPFGTEPVTGTVFILGCDAALSHPASRVRVSFSLSGAPDGHPPAPSADLAIAWEYHDGEWWREIGTSRTTGPAPPAGHDFTDRTRAMARSGTLSFIRPRDLRPVEVDGERVHAIRARIDQGDFGVPGRHERSGPGAIWREDRPVRPPRVETIRIDFDQAPFHPRRCLSYNDFLFRDHSRSLGDEVSFQPFEDRAHHSPALYLGLDAALSEGPIEIYFRLVEDFAPDEISVTGQKIAWEVRGEERWERLPAEDRTGAFTRSGGISFTGPRRHPRVREFGQDLHWIRARLISGTYLSQPRLIGIHLNTTTAVQGVTIRDEILGHSDGTPHQEFRLASPPALSGSRIQLREAGVEGEASTWREVGTLALSGPDHLVYEIDPIAGTVRFGGGRRGRVPPPGEVRADRYRTGGGSVGNVGSRTITVIRRAVAGIDSVVNPYPAAGGVDPEGSEEATARAIRAIRSQDRAVTLADYESLAAAASRWVARAHCFSDRDGEVTVVVIPRGDPHRRADEPLRTPVDLLDRVRVYLDERRPIATRLQCRGPSYVDVDLTISLTPASPGADPAALRDRIDRRLRDLFDPLTGGPDGRGWPPGRSVTRADIHETVGAMAGVRYLEEVRISSPGREGSSSRLPLPPQALPWLSRLDLLLEDGRGTS